MIFNPSNLKRGALVAFGPNPFLTDAKARVVSVAKNSVLFESGMSIGFDSPLWERAELLPVEEPSKDDLPFRVAGFDLVNGGRLYDLGHYWVTPEQLLNIADEINSKLGFLRESR